MMMQNTPSPLNSLRVRIPRVAQLSLYHSNQVRLFFFPAEVENVIRSAIKFSYKAGIRSERANKDSNSYDFILHGTPWIDHRPENVPAARNVIHRILEVTTSKGWLATLGTRSRMSESEIASIWFEYRPPSESTTGGQRRDVEWLSVTYLRSGFLHIGGETDLRTEFSALLDISRDDDPTRQATANLPAAEYRRPRDLAAHRLMMARVYQSLVALKYENVLSVSFGKAGHARQGAETLYCVRARNSGPCQVRAGEPPNWLTNGQNTDGSASSSNDRNGSGHNASRPSGRTMDSGQSGCGEHGNHRRFINIGREDHITPAGDVHCPQTDREDLESGWTSDPDLSPALALDSGDGDNPFSDRYAIASATSA